MKHLGNRWTHLLIAAAVGAALACYVRPWETGANVDWWTRWDAVLGPLTLILALVIWLGETLEARESKLPKRLTAIFEYQGREMLRCERAYLAGDGDIRQWGMQLGRQMAGSLLPAGSRLPELSLEPRIRQTGPATLRAKASELDLGGDPEKKISFKSYEVRFFLTKLPEGLAERQMVRCEAPRFEMQQVASTSDLKFDPGSRVDFV